MLTILNFVFYIVGGLISLAILAMIIAAVLSWLIAFDILNTRHPMVYRIDRLFTAVTRPIVAPFQRFIPLLGGVDVSFVVAILVLGAIENILLPGLYRFLVRLIG